MSTSQTPFTLVVGFLGACLLICTVGAITLAAMERPIPELVGQLAVASIAGLAGLLARTPSDGSTQPVRVVNDGGQPVLVEQA